jgi:DNA polymerase theta
LPIAKLLFANPVQDQWVILSADYSQIEVRLMAHFSEEPALIALLRKPSGDLFRMIASQWTGISEIDVSDKQREQTKKLVYGILYGMGVNALAEQLDCPLAEASLNLEKFRCAFPGIHSWLQQACVNCRKSG